MNLAIVQRISTASESACVAVLQEPKDKAARERLFLALADLIDPAFQGEETDDYYSGQLIREVRLWADIVRTRIQLARDSPTMKPTLRITYSVQQLLLMLSDLARECSRADIALTLLDLRSPGPHMAQWVPVRLFRCERNQRNLSLRQARERATRPSE